MADWHHMVTRFRVNSGDGLFPDSKKPWINIDLTLVRFCGIHLRSISQRVLKVIFNINSLNVIHLNSLPQLPVSENNHVAYIVYFTADVHFKKMSACEEPIPDVSKGVQRHKTFGNAWKEENNCYQTLLISLTHLELPSRSETWQLSRQW